MGCVGFMCRLNRCVPWRGGAVLMMILTLHDSFQNKMLPLSEEPGTDILFIGSEDERRQDHKVSCQFTLCLMLHSRQTTIMDENKEQIDGIFFY